MSQPEFDPSGPVGLTREEQVRRQHRRQTLTFLGLFGFVAFVGLIALGNWLQWWTIGGTGEPTDIACTSQAVSTASRTSVNVYNATTRSGLAAAVAKEMRTRGFKVLTVGTERPSKPVQAVAVIRYGSAGKAAAQIVELQFPSRTELVRDGRKTRAIDVVIGIKYAGMVGRSKAAEAIAPKSSAKKCVAPSASSAPS